ncbi:hypothetical protein [Dokdonella immobilis]|uniref:Uncharacterized protein n=1 Tax=Dokdonella immobilis TaxID=578942 RepID=A0A1I4VGW8_9GAMM|nr:hypothetical protein [Dokdonella immobilis]SFN00418.1 hypothetical protein SAMN05216289_10276 [Dokdonella immobilis]
MLSIRLICGVLLAFASCVFAAEPFLAPAVSSGSISVQLVPTEVVAPGNSTLVTFGVPFPRGSINQAGLATVRVFKGGNEVPAFVDQLTPWRHRLDPALDGTSVRVARIQIHNAFSGSAAETVTVSWGGAARQLNVTTLTPVRSAWHTVTSGSFIASDNVQEPDVYAVLPKDWLSLGALKGNRSVPFDASNNEARDNPFTNSAIDHWPAYYEADRAAKNNFYSLINEDDAAVTAANQCKYKTDYEPWLYDRASSMFTLYFRSGFYKSLREAVRASDFYTDHVNASGFFDLKNGDTKYVYAENLAYRYWLTGDDAALTRLSAIVSAQAGFGDNWTPATGFWTERHAAFKLLANQISYEINGGSQATVVATLVGRLVTHQNGANGQIPQPTGFVDGGLYHYGSQHDGDWADGALGASSWMSVLVVDAMLRAYSTSEDPAIANFVRRMGNFLRVATITTTDHGYDNYGGALALPRYAVLSNGVDGQVDASDVEHGLDVAAATAWANYFAELTQQPDPRLAEVTEDLYFTYDTGVNFWIRPNGPGSGLPAYRVSPWRKYGWEHRVSGGLGWAVLASTSSPDPVFANGFD